MVDLVEHTDPVMKAQNTPSSPESQLSPDLSGEVPLGHRTKSVGMRVVAFAISQQPVEAHRDVKQACKLVIAGKNTYCGLESQSSRKESECVSAEW